MANTAVPGTSRRCSSRLSLSQKFASTSRPSSRCSNIKTPLPSSPVLSNEDNDIMNILTQDPFKLTNRTLAEEDDLISKAPDAMTISSKESSKEQKPFNAISVISVSSGSDREMSPTPKKSVISQFFTPVKSRRNSVASRMAISSLKSKTDTSAQETPSSKSVSKTNLKKGNRERKRICKSTNIKMLSKKHFDESQKRITNFFLKNEDKNLFGYHRVLKESAMPAINTGDADIEGLLEINLSEESSPIKASQLQGPPMSPIPSDPAMIMERIEKVQSACYDKEKEDWNMENTNVSVVVSKEPEETADSGYSNDVSTVKEKEKLSTKQKRNQKVSTAKRKSLNTTKGLESQDLARKGPVPRKTRKTICPKYKIIAGTRFAVDAFRYGDIEGVSHYFLTHFHADHYIGLKRSFAKPLIMSSITARLVKAFINVSEDYYTTVELHVPITIDEVRITALDANHCPGGVMFLFQLPDGTNILHTGDFRASADMEEYPEFWNMDIDLVYLDTTYLSSKYAFKSQWESITDVCRVIRSFLDRNIGSRVLIVCGSYLIGKEKVWAEVATQFNYKVWTEPNRRKALNAIADSEQQKLLIDNPKDADVHVLSINTISYDGLVAYLDSFPDQYDSVIAIRPSGWEKNSRPQLRGKINIIGVEYSEHSSYDELKRFVRFLRPKEVISTVPYGNSNLNRTPQVPISWYQGPIRPEQQVLQMSITSFVKVVSKQAPKIDPKADKTSDDCIVVVSDDVPVSGSLVVPRNKMTKPDKVREVEHSSVDEPNGNDSDSDWMP
ncbi:DNA cross-link repair 1A protein-like [Sabethes cyaneus]|uniref:DNA cross-link repair 1A protein-like n=1 Tax=Sabethes cyaneus TaxID=53552 RepID=UPI00237E6B78|nr:DNA cross-link repair 1A protein-like [Sabethes cyaneus]